MCHPPPPNSVGPTPIRCALLAFPSLRSCSFPCFPWASLDSSSGPGRSFGVLNFCLSWDVCFRAVLGLSPESMPLGNKWFIFFCLCTQVGPSQLLLFTFVIVSRASATKSHYKHRESLCLNVSSINKRHNNIFIVQFFFCDTVLVILQYFLYIESCWVIFICCNNYFEHYATSRPSLLHSVCIPGSLGHIGWYLIISKSGICQSCTS